MIRIAMKRTLQSIRALVAGKARLLSILLTPALLMGLKTPSYASSSASFDTAGFRDLNHQANQVWSEVLRSFGNNKTAAIRAVQNPTTVPANVRALAQNLRQYMLTSPARQNELRAMTYEHSSRYMQSLIGEEINPLLRLLLVASTFMDSMDIQKMTKPGLFTGDHGMILVKLYEKTLSDSLPQTEIELRAHQYHIGNLLVQTTSDSTNSCDNFLSPSWSSAMLVAASESEQKVINPLLMAWGTFVGFGEIPAVDELKCYCQGSCLSSQGMPSGYSAERLLKTAHGIFGE